jgi:type I restriction enzyme, R subunit
VQLISAGKNHVREQVDGRNRSVRVVTELSNAFALCDASDDAKEISDDVSYSQTLKAQPNM